ncbi:MAG: HdeD family acid-resistance protein [Bacteroides sp.]|nr:HdeD family acid-resistance protein [Bacteroides sp.]MCD8081690.1 HdeD family acid-resistance protein [Bacteroides sp.]
MRKIYDNLEYTIKHWWMSLLLGILYLIVAIFLIINPLSSYVALSLLFSITMLVTGVVEIVFALGNRKQISSWGWYLAGGIIDLILGVYLLAYPWLSMEVIPFIIAFWLMFRGFSAAGYSLDLKRYGTREWGWYLAFGILAIICSIIILWQPLIGALYAVYMIAFTFLAIGMFRIMLAFELKGLYNRSKESDYVVKTEEV